MIQHMGLLYFFMHYVFPSHLIFCPSLETNIPIKTSSVFKILICEKLFNKFSLQKCLKSSKKFLGKCRSEHSARIGWRLPFKSMDQKKGHERKSPKQLYTLISVPIVCSGVSVPVLFPSLCEARKKMERGEREKKVHFQANMEQYILEP